MQPEIIPIEVTREITVNRLCDVRDITLSKKNVYRSTPKPNWEIMYLDRGIVDISAQTDRFRLRQGDLYVCVPEKVNHAVNAGANAAHLVTVVFGSASDRITSLCGRVFRCRNTERQLLARLLNEAAAICSSSLPNARVDEIVGRENSRLYARQMTALILEQLIIVLLRRNKEQALPVRTLSPAKLRTDRELVERIVNFMRDRVCGNLTFSDVCRYSAQSATGLKVIFKSVTGRGVMETYRLLKIDRAKKMLQEGQGNITQIADCLGYNSVHYFSRYFKQITGMSPSEYAASLQAQTVE